MDTPSIFLLQFSLSIVAWTVTMTLLVSPWLSTRPRHEALMWLVAPHAFRHIGMVFLVPGVVDQTLPIAFSQPAAYGDLAAGLLALLAIVALHYRWSLAIASVWLFNVVGFTDLVNALRHVEIVPLFGATWYIPTMLVPLLIVTHLMIFRRLLTWRRTLSASDAASVAIANR